MRLFLALAGTDKFLYSENVLPVVQNNLKSAVKSECKVQFGQMRYCWIDLMEIHHYKLFKPQFVVFLELKTRLNSQKPQK